MKLLAPTLLCCLLASSASAQSLIVPTLGGNDLLLVEQNGSFTVFASQARPFLTKFDAAR